MSTKRIPRQVVRARMAETGETYQQALAALDLQVPDHHLLTPPDDTDCVGRCLSQFLAADAGGDDGGSMIECAYCPGSVCVECGRSPVAEPFACCATCEALLEGARRREQLALRCNGRTCISRRLAGTSDSDSASVTCESCGWPICFCGSVPVETPQSFCDQCDRLDDGYDDVAEIWEEDDRRQALEWLRDLARLIVVEGGGTRRQVHARLGRALGQRHWNDADLEALYTAVSLAQDWLQQLRAPGTHMPDGC
jgi:hypothetical protein